MIRGCGMKKLMLALKNFFSNRSLILAILVIGVAIIYIGQLFSIQIIQGKEFREQSEKRMLRTENIVAPRGEIYDRNGVVLATSKLSFNVNLYKVNVEIEEQNDAISQFVRILDANQDKIDSTFPVNEDFNYFNFSSAEEEKKWKKEMKVPEEYDFEQTISYFMEKYKYEAYAQDKVHLIKMIEVKYEANLNAYSLFNGATIAKDISQKSVAQIEENKNELYGFQVVSVPKRHYPTSNLLSHVVGYVSKINGEEYKKLKEQGYTQNSVIGKSGVELTFDKYLKGSDGVKKVETDAKGNVSSETVTQETKSGNSITLTIDYRLQKVAQEALESTIRGLQDGSLTFKKKPVPDAKSGSVVVLDCQTGEVLAMANYPNYDTNLFVNGISTKEWNEISNDPLKPMYNRAISGTYAPGSTYKMLVGLVGLQTKKFTIEEKYLDTGIYQHGYHPKCWKYTENGTTHGWVNISDAIKGSCNLYFYEVGRRAGIAEIVKWSKEFGLGRKTGIELPQESIGTIAGADPNAEDGLASPWYLGDTLSAAIGQSSNSYTPIQMANYISAIANGGRLNKVSVIKEVKNESTSSSISLSEIEKFSNEYTKANFEEKDLQIDQNYLNAIKKGMLSVTNEVGGTANIVFKNSNITVAGKTGTSQVTSGSNNGIFVGFAPYESPKIAVVAVIEHGEEGTYTANVVKPIMEEYFNISSTDKSNEKEANVVERKIAF